MDCNAFFFRRKIMTERLILASQSPRRRELLEQIGIEFTVQPSTVEEKITETDPRKVVQELAHQKAEDVAASVSEGTVLGADTIVVLDGKIMGKPKSRKHAVEMLQSLQGRTHSVFTGVALIRKGAGSEQTLQFAEETQVTMYPMSREEIENYVDTKEPMDKAGAYGIQGRCAAFIERISGDYNNVVGLPVARIYQELKNWK